jgi:3',5'-cyclic AMP phosphodiesterase CpdA
MVLMSVVKSDEQTVYPSDETQRGCSADETNFTLAHLSDAHLFCRDAIRWSQFLNKRIFGLLSWHFQRRLAKTDQILAAVLADLAQRSIDHVVVTGDLTHVGLPCDFGAARQFLHGLGPSSRVTAIPGNHDTLVRSNWQATFAQLAEYMVSDDSPPASALPSAVYPTVRIRSSIAVIGVSTAHPSPPFLAVGAIGTHQLERLRDILQETGAQGLLRIVLIHHPPIPGAVSWRKRLTDQTAFEDVVSQYGAELILHGHTHRSSVNQLKARNGPIPVIGAPSVTLHNDRRGQAQYHLYGLKKSAGGWKMLMTGRCLSPSQDHLVSKSFGELQIPRANQ